MIYPSTVWNKYRKWSAAEFLLHESEETLFKDILNTMDVDKTYGSEIDQKIKTHAKMTKMKALYMQKIFCLLLKFIARGN